MLYFSGSCPSLGSDVVSQSTQDLLYPNYFLLDDLLGFEDRRFIAGELATLTDLTGRGFGLSDFESDISNRTEEKESTRVFEERSIRTWYVSWFLLWNQRLRAFL